MLLSVSEDKSTLAYSADAQRFTFAHLKQDGQKNDDPTVRCRVGVRASAPPLPARKKNVFGSTAPATRPVVLSAHPRVAGRRGATELFGTRTVKLKIRATLGW